MAVLHALPSLRGRRGRVVRAVYLSLAAFAFVISMGGLVSSAIVEFRDQFSGMHYGVLVASDDLRRPNIGKVWAGVTTPGVAVDDRVIAVDGHHIAASETQFAVARMLRSAGPVMGLDLAHDGKITHYRVKRIDDISKPAFRRGGLQPMLFAFVQVGNTILLTAFFFVISLLLFIRRPRDPMAMLLAFGFLLQAINPEWDAWVTSSTGIYPPVLDWLENALGELGWWCILFGMCAFPDGRFVTRWSRYARLMPTAYVAASLASNFALWQWSFATLAVDIPIFTAVVGSLLLRYRKLSDDLERQQIKLAALGAVVMVVVTVIMAVLGAPVIAQSLSPTATYLLDTIFGDLKAAAFPIGLMVSLLRYRLYDADKVITRSAGYATLTVTIVVVFACTEQGAQGVAQEYLGGNLGPLASGLGAAVAAVVIGPLHRRITDWSERYFRSELIALRRGLPVLVSDMREMAGPVAIAEAAMDRVLRSVRAQHVAIVTDSGLFAVREVAPERVKAWLADVAPPKRHHLVRKDADLLFPLRVPLAAEGVGHIGWLLLGPRPDGSTFGRDEREALMEVSDPLARTLVIAADRERREATHAQTEADRDERLAALERRIAFLFSGPLRDRE